MSWNYISRYGGVQKSYSLVCLYRFCYICLLNLSQFCITKSVQKRNNKNKKHFTNKSESTLLATWYMWWFQEREKKKNMANNRSGFNSTFKHKYNIKKKYIAYFVLLSCLGFLTEKPSQLLLTAS